MKKILYFAALSLLLCGSCNYEKQDEEHLIIEDEDYPVESGPIYRTLNDSLYGRYNIENQW